VPSSNRAPQEDCGLYTQGTEGGVENPRYALDRSMWRDLSKNVLRNAWTHADPAFRSRRTPLHDLSVSQVENDV